MKKRLNIILAFAALIILLSAQVYVISELYKLRNRVFIQDYGAEILDAVNVLEDNTGNNPLHNVYIELNRLASDILFDIPDYELQSDSVKTDVIKEFSDLLNENEQVTESLKLYLNERNLDSEIKTFFYIHNLKLLNFNREYPIFSDTDDNNLFTQNPVKKNAIFLGRYIPTYDYFRMEVSYYVDFNNRKKIVIAEMSSVLIILTITLCAVLFVYLRTLRNMLKQRKLSELKSDFISNMTHELKTPLSTIAVASASLALDQIASDRKKSKELSEIINRQNKLLNQMIDQVLDISSLEKSGFTLSKEKVEVKPFMREIIEAFRINQSKNEITIIEEFDIEEGFVAEFDTYQFTRVFNNLFSNAVKYCDQKPEIRSGISLKPGFIIFWVKDNGIGISKDDAKQVFSKFYRGNLDLNKKVKGLGLGLYFVQRIVQAHGGIVKLESTPGKGSTFTIELPLNK
ncbi:MAG: HAMP domain-containing histidine kinase [Prolixibacteraceae bacterium]|nr:HAMP domain-containing histidine kinase [Prolixibacteraceae bacterium]